MLRLPRLSLLGPPLVAAALSLWGAAPAFGAVTASTVADSEPAPVIATDTPIRTGPALVAAAA